MSDSIFANHRDTPQIDPGFLRYNDGHAYDGERCVHCGINIYDALDGTPCVDHEPLTYTTETPTAEETPVTTTDIHDEASRKYAEDTAGLTDDEARELAGAYLDLMNRVMYAVHESCKDQVTITFTPEKTFLIEPVHEVNDGPKRTRQLNVRLNTSEHERLEQLADELDKTVSDVMREALAMLFENPPQPPAQPTEHEPVHVNIMAPVAEAVLDVPADES